MTGSKHRTCSLEEYQSSLAGFLLQTEFNEAHPVSRHIQTPGNIADKDLSNKDRLAVYRNNVMHSLTDALAAQFPIVKRLVGDSFFLALARDYVSQHPPQEASLTFYGEYFSEFIAAHEHCQLLPYLADVASLELCCQYCLHAADDPRLQAEELVTLSEDEFACMQLHLRQSLTTFRSKFGAVDIWHENQLQEPGQLDLTSLDESRALIYRQNHQVKVINLRQDIFYLLQQIQQGKNMNDAYEACQNHLAIEESQFSDMLGFLLGLGIFSAYQLTKS